MISICVPFQNGKISLRREFAPRGSEFFLLRAVPYTTENHAYHIRWPLLNVTIFITHVRNYVKGATSMLLTNVFGLNIARLHINSVHPVR